MKAVVGPRLIIGNDVENIGRLFERIPEGLRQIHRSRLMSFFIGKRAGCKIEFKNYLAKSW